MQLNSVTPIRPITTGTIDFPKVSDEGSAIPFKDLFADVLDQANETSAASAESAVDMALGEEGDLHSILIAGNKADIAVSLLVQLRNKAYDAYSEIMRINL